MQRIRSRRIHKTVVTLYNGNEESIVYFVFVCSVIEWQLDVHWTFLSILEMLAVER